VGIRKGKGRLILAGEAAKDTARVRATSEAIVKYAILIAYGFAVDYLQ